MPLLFSLGQQRALRAIAGELQAGERLFAFLDDLYVSCQPARVAAIHRLMRVELWRHSKISVHHGKTKLWNKAGVLPSGVEELQQLASSVDEEAVVWRGNPLLQSSRQGIKILGTPIGHEDFVRAQLTARRTDHDVLLDRIPAIPDLQAAWLLLSYCASVRANFELRTGEFRVSHDAAIWKCLTTLLGVQASAVPELTHRTVSLPVTRGGLGLQSASRTHIAACWASWADGLAMVQKRHPDVAHLIIGEMHEDTRSESIRGVVECEGILQSVGFDVPTWNSARTRCPPIQSRG